jgi:hypothetical protein
VDFSDLEDKEFWGREMQAKERAEDEAVAAYKHARDTDLDTDTDRLAREITGGHRTNKSTVGRYTCTGCAGRGYITVYRRGGGWGQAGERKKCWKGCGGTGFTKTSPEVRAANKDRRARRKQMKIDQNHALAEQFLEANPKIAAFFEKNKGNPSWSFPDELREKLFQYGELTPGQIGAIEKCVARDEERAAKWAKENEAIDGLDLRSMHSGYYAVPDGDTRLKVRIDVVTEGKWAGWVFVKDGAEYGAGQKYGSQRPGATYRGQIVEELMAIADDPTAAMAAYGHLVGRCGMCGRKLEDEKSIERGIGPVCASKL